MSVARLYQSVTLPICSARALIRYGMHVASIELDRRLSGKDKLKRPVGRASINYYRSIYLIRMRWIRLVAMSWNYNLIKQYFVLDWIKWESVTDVVDFVVYRKLADISPLLDVEDMVRMKNPDWKCVFTYVQSFYRRFAMQKQAPPSPSSPTAAENWVALPCKGGQKGEGAKGDERDGIGMRGIRSKRCGETVMGWLLKSPHWLTELSSTFMKFRSDHSMFGVVVIMKTVMATGVVMVMRLFGR